MSALPIGYLGSWLIDDAGISIAYSRSLQSGRGLVSQLGAPPVEGFSNPLWVFLLAVLPSGGTPASIKLFAGFLFLFALMRIATGFRGTAVPNKVALLSSFLVATQSSVLIWVFSGLENPLFLALTVEVLIGVARLASGIASRGDIALAATACALAVLTRPDGAALTFVLLLGVAFSEKTVLEQLKMLVVPLVIPGTVFVLWLTFRINYFGDWLPAPYYAKGGPTLSRAVGILQVNAHTIGQVRDFFSSVFGVGLAGAGAVFSGLIISIAALTRSDRALFALIGAASCLLLVALLLPSDWMGENRYFTAVYPAVLLLLAYSAWKIIPRSVFVVGAGVVTALSAFNCWDRVSTFSKQPTISIAEVAVRGMAFERWGDALGLERPSVLIADIGGILLRDEVAAIDLGMLCDLRIAKYLGEGVDETNVAAFHDYIFAEKKPDFISTRAYHAWIAKFDDDPRFVAMYRPIQGYVDQWVLTRYGRAVTAGDFVRADLVDNKPDVLEQIRMDASKQFYPFCLTCGQPGAGK